MNPFSSLQLVTLPLPNKSNNSTHPEERGACAYEARESLKDSKQGSKVTRIFERPQKQSYARGSFPMPGFDRVRKIINWELCQCVSEKSGISRHQNSHRATGTKKSNHSSF